MKKKKYWSFILGTAVILSLLAGCAEKSAEKNTETDSTETSAAAVDTEEEKVIYGEVSKINADSIVIALGTLMGEPGGPGEGGTEAPVQGGPGGPGEGGTEAPVQGEPGGPGEGDGEAPGQGEPGNVPQLPSMLVLTGEEQEIPVLEDTVFEKQTEEQSAGTETISLEDISQGNTIKVSLDAEGNAVRVTVLTGGGFSAQPDGAPTQPGGDGMRPGGSAGVTEYKAVTEYTEDIETENASFNSTGTDENAVLVSSGAKAVLRNTTITRTSDDSTGGDASSFYGVGAAVLVADGAAYVDGGTIDTDAAGGAGVFAYGDGVAYVSNTVISTQQDTSGGIHAAGGGALYAWDVTAQTNGESSAAIRSDRGGGKMVVDGGSYTSNGTGSPAVYCTAEIAIHQAELVSNDSEAVCIEGLNSLHLFDCDLTGSMGEDERNDCIWNVILYQSMSGDSQVGNSVFEMVGGTLTAEEGGMFYTTNTESTFVLSDVDITYPEENDFFLRCTGNANQRGWGQTGSNGADCHFTAKEQKMEGNIVWDSISQLDFYMTDESSLKGAVVNDESCAGEGGTGFCNFYLEEGCTWTVTGDSVLTTLACAGKIQDEEGKTVTIRKKDGNILAEGESVYTITVDSYETLTDMSEASQLTLWTDYEEEKPEEFS